MKLKKTNKLEVADRKLLVNGRPFVVQHPNEPLWCVEDGLLETIVFKACGYTSAQREPEEIEGYFPDQETDIKVIIGDNLK